MTDSFFKGLCICTTGLELHVKEQIRKIVLACGGAFQDDLALETTTHLIADAVGTQKHRAAVGRNVHVCTSQWIFDSFRAHTLLDKDAYRLRLFEGLVICTTGLASQSRDQVERIATLHGAIYDPNLEIGHTSVLIAQRIGGAKYEAAIEHGIPVAHISWLHACIEHDTLLEETEFSLEKILQPSRLYVKLQAEIKEIISALPDFIRRYNKLHVAAAQYCGGEDDDIDAEVCDWMDLFEDCVFHLLGFPPHTLAMLQHILRSCMGTIYYEMNVAHVTHVLVSPSLQDLKELTALEEQIAQANAEARVHLMSAKWVLDSIKCLRIEPEELYPVEIDEEHHVDVTVSRNSAVNTDVLMQNDEEAGDPAEELGQDEDNELSQDPIRSDDQRKKLEKVFSGSAFLLICLDPNDRKLIYPMIKDIRHRGGAQAIALDYRDLPHLDPMEFSFLTHFVICSGVTIEDQVAMQLQQQFTKSQPVEEEENGNNDNQPKRKRRKRIRFVSDLWVNCCLNAQVVLSHQSHELFSLTVDQPRSMFVHPLPLDCFRRIRASTSVYVNVDRVVIMELLRLAGADVTTKMSKRNTHLICLKKIGMKYEKAKEWGIVIVTARWVVQSMMAGELLDHQLEEFQVQN